MFYAYILQGVIDMRKQEYDWGEFCEDDEDWSYNYALKKKRPQRIWLKFCKQIAVAAILFGCFYGMRSSQTEMGELFSKAADYSVNTQLHFSQVRELADPYISRFAEVEILQGVQTVAAKVMRPVSIVEKPDDWLTGEFDGERRFYTLQNSEAVKSMGGGRILDVREETDGKRLTVQYGDRLEAAFGRLDEVYVEKGERVRLGQVLGVGSLLEGGTSGFSLSVRQNGRPIDAEALFQDSDG